MERLGPVVMADDIRVQLDSACDWVRRLRKEGADWSPPALPDGSRTLAQRGGGRLSVARCCQAASHAS